MVTLEWKIAKKHLFAFYNYLLTKFIFLTQAKSLYNNKSKSHVIEKKCTLIDILSIMSVYI